MANFDGRARNLREFGVSQRKFVFEVKILFGIFSETPLSHSFEAMLALISINTFSRTWISSMCFLRPGTIAMTRSATKFILNMRAC